MPAVMTESVVVSLASEGKAFCRKRSTKQFQKVFLRGASKN
jgi:hypothetical protein